jgi:mono/diheme cytochrome c family protein
MWDRPSAGLVRPAFLCFCLAVLPASVRAEQNLPAPALVARVVAVDIPGAGPVSQVGYFHPGGPIHDNPGFAAFTKSGRILDPQRVLVAGTSNFGEKRARPQEPGGIVLSIDTSGTDVLVIPGRFAAGGGQAATLTGRVQIFTAQDPAFINGVNTPKAVTAELPPVSNPLGISINNGFGRLWFANAPFGARGPGTESIVDPGGQPLAGAPSKIAGGVFAGDRTDRKPQRITGGLRAGAIATALLGMSPDGSKRAVFAVLTADGALVQAHTEQNVDGLAPPGTIGAIPLPASGAASDALVTRAGMLLNWVPDRILYASDPMRNAILALTLADDGVVFRVAGRRRIEAPEFDAPVDIAAAVPEIGNPAVASNTTLAGGSDIYVANRGNGTVLRLSQAGKVLAVRHVSVAGETLGPRRLNGIAVSRDARRIWLTVSGPLPGYPHSRGGLIVVPAFRGERAASAEPIMREAGLARRGAELFQTALTVAQGLGPLYNARSCSECHGYPSLGGTGPAGLGLAMRIGRFADGAYDPLLGRGGPIARRHAIGELGVPCALAAGLPAGANLVSLRNAPSLFGTGLIDSIPDAAIRARAAAETRQGIAGRPNLIRDGLGRAHVGRFGWKADTTTLEEFVAEAMRDELGITNPLRPADLVAAPPRCEMVADPKDSGRTLRALTAFVASLPSPASSAPHRLPQGARLFASLGCASCHAPMLPGARGDVPLYSDLLLHDMGAALDDNVVQGQARGRDWRTTPLWGLRRRVRFLHDGRATTLAAAIAAHDGEAGHSAAAFRSLPVSQQNRLIAFLQTL